MSTDIVGWIEIKKHNVWCGVVKINDLMLRNYLMFDLLFGGRSGHYDTALAAKRGLPADRSREVLADMGDDDTTDGEASWIRWSELQALDLASQETLFSDDWRRLFDIMRILANSSDVSDVRLVIDFF